MKYKFAFLLFALMALTSCHLWDTPPAAPALAGKLVFHRYEDYLQWKAQLFMLEFFTGKLEEISLGWNIDEPINAHFSPDGSKIVFMGSELGAQDWDIFLWSIGSKERPKNLTSLQGVLNGKRDEDPKFSPDGKRIVFKHQGDIWEMDLTGKVTRGKDTPGITADGSDIEDSMPYYTADGFQRS